MRVEFRRVDWELAAPFRISYRTSTVAETVVVELRENAAVGRGEGVGVSYHGETADSMMKELDAVRPALERGITREALQELLPPGGARNAVDCALWDLHAKRAGRRVWELAALTTIRPLVTAYTICLDTPELMGQAAAAAQRFSLLKLKLDGGADLERVLAVRKAHPQARIIVDANQAWSEALLHELAPQFARLRVELIEQPLPRGGDAALGHFRSAVPLCADESCQTAESLPELVGRYQYINIKLDKTGGLTEALKVAHVARALGFERMVGCMFGSSLSMAPAFVVGQLCSIADLDGPLLAKADVPDAIRYEGSRMFVPRASLWG